MEEIRSKVNSILEYFIAFYLIIGANSVYSRMLEFNLHINVLTLITLFLYVLNKFIIKNSFKESIEYIKSIIKKYRYFYIVFFIYLIVFLIFNNIMEKNFISLYFLILPMLIFIYAEQKEIIKLIMKKILVITIALSVISLILYFAIEIVHIFDYNQSIKISWGEEKYIDSFLNIFFKTQNYLIHGNVITRNTGIFAEAPMYSLALVLALSFYEFFLKKEDKLLIRGILILTLLTTFSTTGYISVILIYLFKVVSKIKIKNQYMKYVTWIVIVISAILCTVLLGNRLKTKSGSIRIDDYKASFKTWMDGNFIKGAGFGNEDAIKNYMSEFREDNQGLSNSLMVVLAEGGIYLFMLYAVPFAFTLYKSIKNKEYNIAYFIIILLFLFMTTIFFYTNTMVNILALGYAYIIRDRKYYNGNKLKNEKINNKKLYL